MQNSRRQILEVIKKQGKATLEDLATALGLSSMTVRQHLAILEREGYVVPSQERRPLGRPRYVFSLSLHGEDQFPKSYALLAEQLLQEIVQQDGEARVAQLFEGIAQRLAAAQRPRLADLPLPKQLSLITQLMNDEGQLAEWVETETSYTLLAYNCPYLRVAHTHDQLCNFHHRLLNLLLDAPVYRGHCLMEDSPFCSYNVDKPIT